MVRFVSLNVENFFSYGKADIQFKPGLVLLEGRLESLHYGIYWLQCYGKRIVEGK
jgi:hypothetical protein